MVHASGGPLNDIVVPYNNEPTGKYFGIKRILTTFADGCTLAGYHATDPTSFAEGFHKALSLPALEMLAMRQRARALSIERFSTAGFEQGWARGWESAVRSVRV